MSYTVRRILQAWRVGCAGKQALYGIQRPRSMDIALLPNASRLHLLAQCVPEFNRPPWWTFNTPNGTVGMYRDTGGHHPWYSTLNFRFPTDTFGRDTTRSYWKLANTMPLWAYDNNDERLRQLIERECTGFLLGDEPWAHVFDPPIGNEIDLMS